MLVQILYGTPDAMLYFPVDKDRSLASDYVPSDLVVLTEEGIATTKKLIKARAIIIDDLQEMIEAAAADGIQLTITSGYRSYERQRELFSSYVKKQRKNGLTQTKAEKSINKHCAYPGHSEHQLGTALDIIGANQKTLKHTSENERAWQWLHAHCEKYGFVLSYPEGKTKVTGYVYEPWHFRWIGKKYARRLKRKRYKESTTAITSTEYLRSVYELHA